MYAPIGFLALLAAVDLASTSRASLSSGLVAYDADQPIGGIVHL